MHFFWNARPTVIFWGWIPNGIISKTAHWSKWITSLGQILASIFGPLYANFGSTQLDYGLPLTSVQWRWKQNPQIKEFSTFPDVVLIANLKLSNKAELTHLLVLKALWGPREKKLYKTESPWSVARGVFFFPKVFFKELSERLGRLTAADFFFPGPLIEFCPLSILHSTRLENFGAEESHPEK